MKRTLKTVNFFDVHDRDVTPIIYTLMFCEELQGNDLTYTIDPWEMEDNEYGRKAWQERLEQGSSNCYFDRDAMKKFCDKPCTYAEAITHFQEWLKERGVKDGEEIQVKIWW